MTRVVVVGAGQAGISAAAALRREGYRGAVTVLGDEPEPPYQRPPLSKAFLAGAAPDLELRSARFYAENAIELRTGCGVTDIDRAARRVGLADGTQVPYDRLVLATGARARLLGVPGHDLDGVLSLRSLADARVLRDRLPAARRVVVIGGGFVGLEVAASLADCAAVTVLDVADRLLARAVSAPLSAHVEAVHRARGVVIHLDTGVTELLGASGSVTGVRDTNGVVHPADVVLVGIGAVPRTGLAERAGLEVSDGVRVDGFLRTSDERILAVGDCARCAGVRLESVQNASDQAAHAARVIARTASGPYSDPPWFWSDQKGLRLQMAGLVAAGDELQVLGEVAGGRFSVLAFREGRLVAVESVNRPADHMSARRLLASGEEITREQTAAPGFTLRSPAPAA